MRPSNEDLFEESEAAWFLKNKGNILTITLNFEQKQQVQEQRVEEQVQEQQVQETVQETTERQEAEPEQQCKNENEDEEKNERQTKKAKKYDNTKKDVFTIPKPVLKQSKLALSTAKIPQPVTEESKFAQWEKVHKLDLNHDRFEKKEASDTTEMTTFQNRNIVCIAAWYTRHILPDGSVSANKSMCAFLESRNVKKMPTFFPTNKRKFDCVTTRNECVQQVAKKLWFRILFQNETYEETIVHFKDLVLENRSKSHFQTLLSNFIEHLCLKIKDKDDQKLAILFLHDVFDIFLQE